ncbi:MULTISPECIES: response regulator transcription factor [Archangium]|uniref:Chemotaxis protein CheY n=1 Tax=Archangium violaceum Cb vi76 TaxID=1406225 RepID=A0A084SFV8_9BACT|nr:MULTISPECIES: response regulator transcription factor [Archangium]KFA87343.1 chemotaxis protein CheY [Archangium violaceum Cb vi76]OJT19562.1 two-component system response regulator [Archangium sp. Cb G35]
MTSPTSPTPGHAPTLLLVDDEAVFRERLARAFRERGFEVSTAGSYDEALALATKDSPELAVVDLKMPGRGGLELVRALHALDASTRIIVLTGYGSIATAVEAVKLGAFNYLPKPADVDDLLLAFTRGPGEAAQVTEDFQPPTLARAEWEHIQRVLTDCGGNISEAARRLGLHRRSLQRKLQKYPPAQ